MIKDIITRIELMATFEQVFGIRQGHTLKEVRASLRAFDDDWTHEEYNASGELVARYESWDYQPPGGTHSSGWRKYDPDGTLLESYKELPL